MKHTAVTCSLIFLFRMLDLFTTYLSNVDFSRQEQNVLVKLFNLNMYNFFIMEIILAFLLTFCYAYSTKKIQEFNIKSDDFISYNKLYFFKKSKIGFFDWLFNFSIKRSLVLFGTIIPVFIITTSVLYSLNNIWVYLFVTANKVAIKYYLLFNDFYFFDILIFVFPFSFLIYLLYGKLLEKYKFYNS